MARIRNDQPLLPSVYDRLIDDDPTSNSEPVKTRNQVLYELKQSVQRDLQNLLNTRWRCHEWPPGFEELELSLINYGIPDFTGINMSGEANCNRLREIIEHVIQSFEPRFIRVRVKIDSAIEGINRNLRFLVEGLLHAEPAPEPVIFDTQLETTSSQFEVFSK